MADKLLSSSDFALAGGAASDIFSSFGSQFRAKGNKIEADSYRQASQFATLEAAVQHSTTGINEMQARRQAYQGLSASEASIAGAGFTEEGSAFDILRSSAQQGALDAAVAAQTGQIAELGYKEQATAYEGMAKASDLAAAAQKMAGKGSILSAGIKIAGIAATFL